MPGVHFVVPTGANQHQALNIRPGQQILDHIERRCVEPLQIVEEQGKRMLPREYTDESTEYQLEAALRVLRRKLGNWGLLSYNELQFGNQIHNELTIRM